MYFIGVFVIRVVFFFVLVDVLFYLLRLGYYYVWFIVGLDFDIVSLFCFIIFVNFYFFFLFFCLIFEINFV